MLIGLDMDGIIANWAKRAVETANKIWDIDLTVNDITQWDTDDIVAERILELRGTEKEDVSPPIEWKRICPPGTFSALEPYPKVYETVKELSEMGDVIIITKPADWITCPFDKVEWLARYLPDIDYKIIFVDDARLKGLISVDYMIDDSSRVMQALDISTCGIMVERPWNREFIRKTRTPSVKRFADIPAKIREFEEA